MLTKEKKRLGLKENQQSYLKIPNDEKTINDILDKYYRQGLSLSQIAKQYNCSKTWTYEFIQKHKFKIGKKIDDFIKDPKPFIQDTWNRFDRMIARLEEELKDLEHPRDITAMMAEIRNLEEAKFDLLSQLGWKPKIEIEKVDRIVFQVKERNGK